ncbi:MAG: class I SAM-dependent methyltransferase [Pseudomonadota bacterium]
MIERTSLADIRTATEIQITNISEHDRDEMAIPSYLHGNPLIRWLMWKRYDTIAELLNPATDKHVLEFGCGVGLFLPHLHKNSAKTYAIDLFPQYAQNLTQKKSISPKFIESLEDIPDASLDTIVAADVLEHIEELDHYLEIFRRKLKSGGQFLVSGPTENFVYRIGRIVAGFAGKGDYHHTNIDKLICDIETGGFRLDIAKRLPFSYLPTLFKICAFTKAD